MTIKTIHTSTDLQRYGFNVLTGEACAYGLRLLFDLSERGAETYREFKGLPYDCQLSDNWNTYVGDGKAVASVLMTRGELQDLKEFLLMHVDKCETVYSKGSDYYGMYESQSTWRELMFSANTLAGFDVTRNPTKTTKQPNANGRNIHAATGRIE